MLGGTIDALTLAEVDEDMTRNATLNAIAKEDCFASTGGLAWRGLSVYYSSRRYLYKGAPVVPRIVRRRQNDDERRPAA
tara:strand:+ start:82 stop:318 length:237 start_codon:yes stop_codon:yes gene_type:complete